MKIVDESNVKPNHHYGLEGIRVATPELKDEHLHSSGMQSLKRIAQSRRSVTNQDLSETKVVNTKSSVMNRSMSQAN